VLYLLMGLALGAGYNEEYESDRTVIFYPLDLLFGTVQVEGEFRLRPTQASLTFGGGVYYREGVLGAGGYFQPRHYVVGDFDRGVYWGGSVGGSIGQDEYYYYWTLVMAGVTGGKWTWDSGFTLHHQWGLGYSAGVGVNWWASLGLGWSF